MEIIQRAICRILWKVECRPGGTTGLSLDEIQTELAVMGLWEPVPYRRDILRRLVNTMWNEGWVRAAGAPRAIRVARYRWYRITRKAVTELNLT